MKKTDFDHFKPDDFLVKHIERAKSVTDNFEFSDYGNDSDDSEIFENSKQNQSDEEFLVPVSFRSVFGRKQAALSTSNPNLNRKSTPKRAAASSPSDQEDPKKPRSKTSLIVKSKK